MKRCRLIVIGLCLLVGIVLAIKVKQVGILAMDEQVSAWVNRYIVSEKLTPFVIALTQTGSAVWIIGWMLMLGWLWHDRDKWSLTALNLIVALLGNRMIKAAMMRQRPSGVWLVHASGYSFPSAHAMISLVFYGMLMLWLMRSSCHCAVKIGAGCLLGLLIVAIGMSRVYVGVHYISDVLAGYCFGAVCLFAVLEISRLWEAKQKTV